MGSHSKVDYLNYILLSECLGPAYVKLIAKTKNAMHLIIYVHHSLLPQINCIIELFIKILRNLIRYSYMWCRENNWE